MVLRTLGSDSPEDTSNLCLEARWGLNTSGLGGPELTIRAPKINNSGPSKPLVFGRKTILVKRAGHFSKVAEWARMLKFKHKTTLVKRIGHFTKADRPLY